MPISFYLICLFNIFELTVFAFLAIAYFPLRNRGGDRVWGSFWVFLTCVGSYSLFQKLSYLLENWIPWLASLILTSIIIAGLILFAWFLDFKARQIKLWRNPLAVRLLWPSILIFCAVSFSGSMASIIAGTRYDLGKQELATERWDAAIDYFSQAINLKPDYAGAYALRALAYHQQGNLNQAVVDYTVALTMNHTNAVVYSNRAMAYQERGDSELALADFERSIARNPNRADVYLYRSKTYLQIGKKELALADLDMCLKIEPQNLDCFTAKNEISK